MKIRAIASNMTELTTNDYDKLLFSYETPVAGWDDLGAFKSEQWYSQTTTRHINKYFDGVAPRMVSQNYIDNLVKQEE